ncbi:MAG: putative ABC transporter ATP-binding protein [Alphaproteobacteria bacterium MarineAlpha11_Bin1]|nr:MAG: putative ABC transporter ATP-binding protein [Alphaproteobacteria bacterium MarineAlpha11_Bin1]|tara:strand:+ start:2507 stop:3223 length:717 start_codon:yes stop_codon:yes gene_type:complete
MSLAVDLSGIVYRWRKALPVVLDIPEISVTVGEKLFVRGPSGSGKTTLLNLLGGVAIPEQGELKILGERLDLMPARSRDSFRADHIGFIFQQFNLIPYLSVIDNVLLPCRFSLRRLSKAKSRGREPEAEARRLLRRMGLPVENLTGPLVTDLSVGQQQMVAAARALIGGPDLIIADEPTSSLDENARYAFLNLLFLEAEEAGQTLIFVSHDGRLAEAFDRIVDLPDINRAGRGKSPKC